MGEYKENRANLLEESIVALDKSNPTIFNKIRLSPGEFLASNRLFHGKKKRF
jgi:hypothetical protein